MAQTKYERREGRETRLTSNRTRAPQTAAASSISGATQQRRSGDSLLVVIMWAWLLFVVVQSLRGVPNDSAGLAAILGAATPVVVYLILFVGVRPRWVSLEGLLVGISLLYGVVVHGSVMSYGLLTVPSRVSISPHGLVWASLCVMVFLGFLALGVRLVGGLQRTHASCIEARTSRSSAARGWLFLALGIGGLLLSFPTADSLIAYWTGTADMSPGPSGAMGYFSTATRALVPIGWAIILDPGNFRLRSQRFLGMASVAIVGVASLSTFSFNRAVLILPAIAVLLSLSGRARINMRRVALGAGSLASLFLAIGFLRESRSNVGFTTLELDSWFAFTVQVYGQLNNNLGVALLNAESFSPQSIVFGVLGPLPGMTQAVREGTGSVIYNRLLYGPGFMDQILPVWAEAWAVGGFALVGLCGLFCGGWAKLLEATADDGKDSVVAFARNWAAVWLAFSVFYSFSNLAQAALYMILPLMIAAWLTRSWRRPLKFKAAL